MIKVSIIVPVYNVEHLLARCVNSLLDQDIDKSEYEIILINDGSKDNSGAIAKDFADNFSNIYYYEQDNQGQAVARNLGMQLARGEYFFFVDSDDYVESNVLGSLYKEAKDNEVDILISTFISYDKNNRPTSNNDYPHYHINVSGTDALLNGLNVGSACARLYCKDFIFQNRLSFPKGMKHEDVYFNILAYSNASRIRSVALNTYHYLWNIGSTDRSFDTDNIIRSILGDIEIAKRQKTLSTEYADKRKDVSKYFEQRSNSVVVSIVLSLYIKNKSIPKEKREIIISALRQNRLFPIKGKTCSRKSWLLSKAINICIR